jgi:hypothetical protein
MWDYTLQKYSLLPTLPNLHGNYIYILYTITDFSLHIVHDVLPYNCVEEAFQVLFTHKI